MSANADHKYAIISGAGPGGLTAAYELLKHTDIIPIIIELNNSPGGISRTINYKGNRIDIGGHRFFSKSDVVMNWWLNILPLEPDIEHDINISYQNKTKAISPREKDKANAKDNDKKMLVRERLSRIFYLRKFFDYPVKMNINTALNLGLLRIVRILFSYLKTKLFPIKKEQSLEDFFINRFGKELYLTFFKDYTEKVWGVSCSAISPEWGAQRIKGLSITSAILHAAKALLKSNKSIEQKNIETSLIERFLYPKFGPGQMWEEVARIIQEKGGIIHFNQKVVGMNAVNGKISSISAEDLITKAIIEYPGDYFFSTMPIKELVRAMTHPIPDEIRSIAENLVYRDFITVGLLLKEMKIKDKEGQAIKDNWIYIQEKDVKIGRLQIFNNWSPYMVKDSNTTWLGLEYFCNEGDELWNMPEEAMKVFSIKELEKIGMIAAGSVLDGIVVKVPKTYPAYLGSYEHFDTLRAHLDRYENLFLIGRNGMHKYNNQDHSMLTAITAVQNIKDGITTKDNIWAINTEEEYHEEKKS